jgi:hypothetical protein
VVSHFCTAILGDYAWGRVVDVLVLAAASLLIGDESLAHVVTAAISVVLAIIAGQPFFVQTSHPTTIDCSYFSFVTMTTVGFDDLTSALNVGRMVAMVEAVFGELHLITVVSLVVQNLGTKHQERREAGEPPGG